MDARYAQRYRELFDHHWWWRAREQVVVEAISACAPAEGFGDILDIGCGDGLFFPVLRHFGQPVGLEADAALVSDARKAAGEIVVTPFDQRFRPGKQFGLIVMLDVLEHLDDDCAAIRHVFSLLRPGGTLLLTVPAFRTLWTQHDELNQHRTRYTRGRLEAVLHDGGLTIDRMRYFFHWLVPLKLLVRLKEALSHRPAEPASVPGHLSNRFWLALSLLEQATWGRIPWPVGTSLIARCARPVG